MTRPIVGIPCDVKMLGPHPFHSVGEKYIAAVEKAADAYPLLLPVLPEPLDLDQLFSIVDGIVLPGSHSNVHPSHYGGAAPREGTLLDPQRDGTTLPLIKKAVETGMPILAICRGFQEMNVVYGGTIHQHVQEVEGRMDHREDKEAPLEDQYKPVHAVKLSEGSLLSQWTGKNEIMVNSLHGQGIDRLGEGLVVEGVAPDGQIEAIRVADAKNYAFGAQWHPEWQVMNNPDYLAIFQAFGDAVRARNAQRNGQ